MKNSYAVVTGASSGIGEQFARKLAAEGYRLVLAARRRDRLDALAAELSEKGTECVVFAADLSKKEECYRLMGELGSKKVGVFINNAGFGDCGFFLDTDVDKELAMIDLNVKSLHLLTKLVLKKMQAQGGGYLLNVASSAGLTAGGPYMATYYATKSYVASLTRAIAQELKDKGSKVYVGALCPGPVDTEFNEVANVEFSMNGMSAEDCVDYAIAQMKRRKTVIVPSFSVRAATTMGRFIPQNLYVRITGGIQKKKRDM
ncbi:MAG: SDR family oxidoreductase [Clostridiales bacterium]|nr:SDR family oxidoreductase [Clostridiales bacterium]